MKKTIQEREADFRQLVDSHNTFPPSMRKEFSDYWTEPNKSGSKMRFETEKTWDLKRRLDRWANNGFGTNKPGATAVIPKSKPKPQSEIELLDEALSEYRHHPTQVEFKSLAKWYDFMYKNQLMKRFTNGEIRTISDLYMPDIELCRAACVQQTFTEYANNTLTFNDIAKAREKLMRESN
jgi:hypothetical protein